MSEDVEVLTPAIGSQRRLPRWPFFVWGGSLVVLFNAGGAQASMEGLLGGPFVISTLALAVIGETALYRRWLGRSAPARCLIALALAPGGIIAGAVVAGLLSAFVGGELAPGATIFGALWFASASVGTAVVSFVDLLGRMFASQFRTRILWVVSGLIAVGTTFAFVVLLGIPKLVAMLIAKAPEELVIQMQEKTMNAAELTKYLQEHVMLPEPISALTATDLIGIGLAMLAFSFMIPAAISAASKLGELAMERVEPLGLAFEHVANGNLAVRVEEGGSKEFKELAQRFNVMVGALDMAQRMERAFGAYVSPHVLDRIREQHGAAELPPSARVATVFFADVRGFTAMSERLEPRQVLDVLDRYYTHVISVVEAHEGYIDKFIGDAIYVVFNGPIDQPDHVLRATRCAIAVQEKVATLNASGAFPEVGTLEVGIGVASGPVVAGNLGTERHTQFSVIGDTVNLASRLTNRVPPGEVWVDAETAAKLPADLSRRELAPFSAKGKEKPVVPWRVFPQASEAPAAEVADVADGAITGAPS